MTLHGMSLQDSPAHQQHPPMVYANRLALFPCFLREVHGQSLVMRDE